MNATADSTNPFRLPAVIDIRESAKLHESLQTWLMGGEAALNGGAVEKIDTSGLQLLLAALRTLQSRGLSLQWVQVSDELRLAAERLGVSAELGLAAGT